MHTRGREVGGIFILFILSILSNPNQKDNLFFVKYYWLPTQNL